MNRASNFCVVCLTLLAGQTLVTTGAQAATEIVLYSFTGNKSGDRGWPEAGVNFDAQGNLFGTTSYWYGNVFELTPSGDSWTHRVIHEFCSDRRICPDGAYPLAGVVFDSAGNLYGTTSYGGDANSWGVVFQLTPNGSDWVETVLCTHECLGDSYPEAELTFDKTGRLFGAAPGNPTFGALGALFELAPGSDEHWKHRVLYQFLDNGDGRHPSTSLVIDEAHNLYGLSLSGGAYNGGTIFEASPLGGGQWSVKAIYDFPFVFGGTLGGLVIDKAGNLFGSAHGQIFKLSRSGDAWTYRTIYTFGTREGGWLSRLTWDKQGNLYGTARIGGRRGCSNLAGCGSVFKLSRTEQGWQKSTIYEFRGGEDGGNPVGGVVLDDTGNLYGATNWGGLRNCNGLTCGVVYKIAP